MDRRLTATGAQEAEPEETDPEVAPQSLSCFCCCYLSFGLSRGEPDLLVPSLSAGSAPRE